MSVLAMVSAEICLSKYLRPLVELSRRKKCITKASNGLADSAFMPSVRLNRL